MLCQWSQARASRLLLAVPAVIAVAALPTGASASDTCPNAYVPTGGTVELRLDGAELARAGLILAGDVSGAGNVRSFVIGGDSSLSVMVSEGIIGRFLPGDIVANGDLMMTASNGAIVVLDQMRLAYSAMGSESAWGIHDALTGQRVFNLVGENYAFYTGADVFEVSTANVQLSSELAALIGNEAAAGAFVGTLSLSASTRLTDTASSGGQDDLSFHGAADGGTTRGFPNPGADVIVCILPQTAMFGRLGDFPDGIVGLAVATTSANMGDFPLNWFQMPNTNHPVIAQNLYRRSTDPAGYTRFEHVGQSWVKHGFCALQLTNCFPCTPAGGGCTTRLGVGCSDPYDASLNANQSNLGARSFINPFTGSFGSNARPSPPPGTTPIDRRLQVADADLDPARNVGAVYYAEGHYVARDDANNGYQANNASYRQVSVSITPGFNYNFSNVGGTNIFQPAINAWTGATQTVVEPTPGADGRAILAYQVTPVAGNLFHYEYGLYNMYVENGFNSFSIPLPPGANVSNVGAHYVRNHGLEATGSTFSNNPWTVTVGGGAVRWATDNFATNPNANALRWGSMFNFRFDANTGPQPAMATIGLFKSGGLTLAATQGPSAGVFCAGDLDGDGDTDLADLGILLSNYGCTGGGCRGDLDGDGDTDLADLGILLSDFGCN